MSLEITTRLEYQFDAPTDMLLQIEAAALTDQRIEKADISVRNCSHFARVPAQDGVGERIWIRGQGQLIIDYHALVTVSRIAEDCETLQMVPLHQLPGDTVPYLMGSRYCPSEQFQLFVFEQFGHLAGGARINAMRDWVRGNVSYMPGVSNSATTAIDTFHSGHGVCRDFAHVMITFARACGIPARIASVYALGVEPQDFHAVAEVFLSDEWHIVDATGMANAGTIAKIGIGRDAADVAFLTAFGPTEMLAQSVSVTASSPAQRRA